MRHHKQQQGFALLLSILVASILLALGLTMLTITTKQLTLSSVARESEIAFQASLAGLECMQFHRKDIAGTFFTEVTTGGTAPAVTCFNASAEGPTGSANPQQSNYDGGGDNYTNEFLYRFSWGDDGSGNDNRCSEILMYIMAADTDADGGDYTNVDFSNINEAIGSGGVKDCDAGQYCTVIVSRGYNKSCSGVDSGQATVQRELTSQL